MAKKTNKTTKKKNKKNFPVELYKRARGCGLGDGQIESYASAEELKSKCDRLSPRTNPDARPKKGVVKPGTHVKPDMPDKFEFDSKMEAGAYTNRDQFDRTNLQAELRRINRTYGTHDPVRVLTDQSNKPVDGKDTLGRNAKVLVTHYTIFMKE